MAFLSSISKPHKVETPFVKAVFGGKEFGLTSNKNSVTGVINSDFITSLSVEKFGSGAVNTYQLEMVYVITPETDPNYVDLVLSKSQNREIYFTYGDLSKPENSYRNEKGIITSVKPRVDYKNNKINYTITATSSVKLNYAIKKTFPAQEEQPSQVIMSILYNKDNGLLDLLPGMLNKDEVLSKGYIPQNDLIASISEKRDVSPLDYLLYLVSLMRGPSGQFYTLRIFDAANEIQAPHLRIISTLPKEKSQMMSLIIGYPTSINVYDFNVSQDESIALLTEYTKEIDKGLFQDYSFRGDLITSDYYSNQVVDGSPSANLKGWWDKMLSFPLTASITTDGLYLPAEIVQSIYLEVFFFGKKYNHTGEYLVMGQKDLISSSGYRTTLSLMRIGSKK